MPQDQRPPDDEPSLGEPHAHPHGAPASAGSIAAADGEAAPASDGAVEPAAATHEEAAAAPAAGPRVELPSATELGELDALETEASAPEVFRPAVAVAWSFGLGGLGAAIWAFITYVTEYELGIIAILLGILAGVGAARGGRTKESQLVGAVAAAACYFLAQILVVFAIAGFDKLDPSVLGLVLVAIIKETFSSMGILFLGIAIFEGYRRPSPP